MWISFKYFFDRTPKHTWKCCNAYFLHCVILKKKSKANFLCNQWPLPNIGCFIISCICLKVGEVNWQGTSASFTHQSRILGSQGCGEVSDTHLLQSCPVSSAVRRNRWRHIASSKGPTSSLAAGVFFFLSLSWNCQVGWVGQQHYLSPPQFCPSPPSLRILVLTWQGLSRGLLPSGLICMLVHRQRIKLSGRAGL